LTSSRVTGTSMVVTRPSSAIRSAETAEAALGGNRGGGPG
jgi:hypothetical protein